MLFMKTTYCLIWMTVWLLFNPELSAQTEADHYRRAIAGLRVASNREAVLPLKRLDTLQIALLPVGLEAQSAFRKVLEQYHPVTADILRANVLIHGVAPGRVPPASAPERSGVKRLLVLFGTRNPRLREGELAAYDAVLHLPDSSYWSQSIAAQALFGGVALSGRTPVDTVRSNRAYRLGFAPPELMGFKADLLRDSIRAILEEGLSVGAFPGAQVLVARNGQVVYHEAVGYATDREQIPLTRDMIYDLASVTKVSASLPALMRLYGQGRFALDTSLATYLPSIRRSNKADLTYRGVLTHTARLRAWIPFWRGTLRNSARYPWKRGWNATGINDFRFRARTFRSDSSARFPVYVTDSLWLHQRYRDRMLKAIRKSPLNEIEGYVYSDLSFYLMPQVVANLSGRTFTDYLREQIYAPLGATTLGFNPLERFPARRIVPTEIDTFFRMQLLHGRVHDEGAAMMGGVSGHAGLFGSAVDLAKLWQLYLNDGVYGDARVIAPGIVDTFARCQFCDQGIRRGIGFDKPLVEYDPEKSSVAEAASPDSFGHSGYTGTFVWADPKLDLLYIFLSNRVYPTRANRGIYIRNIRPRIHAAIYEALDMHPSR